MIVTVNKLQIAVVVLHMSIMRKNVKKVLKSNYGSKEGKGLLNIFDGAKEQLEVAFESLEKDTDLIQLNFNENELNIICSFLSWYIREYELTYEVAGKELHQEDKEQLDLLKDFNSKLESLKEDE